MVLSYPSEAPFQQQRAGQAAGPTQVVDVAQLRIVKKGPLDPLLKATCINGGGGVSRVGAEAK